MSAEPPQPDASTRQRIARKARATGVAALILTSLAILCPLGLFVAEPLAVPVAFGVTDQVDATVVEVSLIAPRRPGRRGGTPASWSIVVQWAADGDGATSSFGRGRGQLSTNEGPEVGDRIRAIELGAGRVSFFSRNTGWLLVMTAAGGAVMSTAGAVWCRQRRRRWSAVARRVGTERPVGVRLAQARFETRRRRQPGRWVLDYRLTDRPGPGGSLFVDDGGQAPQGGDDLEIWAAGANNRSPFLIRRPADDTWWLGGGPDPVPAFGPPPRG